MSAAASAAPLETILTVAIAVPFAVVVPGVIVTLVRLVAAPAAAMPAPMVTEPSAVATSNAPDTVK